MRRLQGLNLPSLGLVVCAGLAGCQAITPALTSLAVAFGQDLIASASVNYAPRYAEQVETLLVAMARESTGLAVEEQLAKAGYRPPPPDYAQTEPYETGYEGEYGSGSYDPNEPYYQEGPYDPNDPYYSDDPYHSDGSYGSSGYSAGGTLRMDVAILVRRAGSETFEAVRDGAVLFDGGGDPARGDLLKFHVQVDRPCYVYVIGIDATGYVAQIFPDPSAGLVNPVDPAYRYMLPTGDQWWGLDAQAGIEHVYFIASIDPRPDIESAARQLSARPRRLAVADYQPVSRPAVAPTRGLVKVQSSPVSVSMGSDTVQIVPETFVQAGDGRAVTVTRWFRHESG